MFNWLFNYICTDDNESFIEITFDEFSNIVGDIGEPIIDITFHDYFLMYSDLAFDLYAFSGGFGKPEFTYQEYYRLVCDLSEPVFQITYDEFYKTVGDIGEPIFHINITYDEFVNLVGDSFGEFSYMICDILEQPGFNPNAGMTFDEFFKCFDEISVLKGVVSEINDYYYTTEALTVSYFHNLIFFFCFAVVFMFLSVILIAVYKESWWNLKGFKSYLLLIIFLTFLTFVFLLYIRDFLLIVQLGPYPEFHYELGFTYGPHVFEHFILSSTIINVQLFILFIFICVLITMYFQALDDFSINFGTPIVMLFCVLGCCLLIMVRDFFVLYLFLELQSLALYVLVCIRKILILVVGLV